jgi:hypothetical protein
VKLLQVPAWDIATDPAYLADELSHPSDLLNRRLRSGALEMLPIPFAAPPGLPAILLVNASSHHSTTAADSGDNTKDSTSVTNTATHREHIECDGNAPSSSVPDRFGSTKLNYLYARYLPTKRRDRTGAWRERKATKTLAIVLGYWLFVHVFSSRVLREKKCGGSKLNMAYGMILEKVKVKKKVKTKKGNRTEGSIPDYEDDMVRRRK